VDNPAKIVLLHIGSNGLDSDPSDVEDILTEIDRYESDFNSEITVFLARIINHKTYSPTVTEFNDNVVAMAQGRIEIDGDKIIIVDMEDGAGIDYPSEMTDEIHPRISAYEKMAELWYAHLAQLNQVPTAEGQDVMTTPDTAVDITLTYTDPDGPGPYTFSIVDLPIHGTLSGDDSDELIGYTPDPGYNGTDSFTFQVNDGLEDSNIATVSINIGEEVILFSENFDRPYNSVVGNGWLETEESGATVGIGNNQLAFMTMDDHANRPMVTHSFQKVSSGKLVWEFEFNWVRTGSERDYRVFMQLGDGALMSNVDQGVGVGVNMVWTRFNGIDETLCYREGGGVSALTVLSGTANVTVEVDLDQYTYEVAIDGSVVGSQVPFDNLVGLDTVRFFVDTIGDENFSGRSFDSVVLSFDN
jgi:hypothetical protein